MTMPAFKHISAKSLKHASRAAAKPHSSVIAGGTDLLGTLKDKIHPQSPDTLIDLKTISGLNHIQETKKSLRIGAMATLREISAHPLVRSRYKALAEAAHAVASPQIRNMGTLGGNLCQEPRCWYYRTPDNQFHCLRKGGTQCGALLGDHRYHSIFGGVRLASPSCTASCPTHVEIAAYMEQIRLGKFKEAAQIILKNNPIPAMTGRICPHTCESRCNRQGLDEAVSIRHVERFLGDYVLEHARTLMRAPKKKTGKAVAIVGSGPAGLSAAYTLTCAGHAVTVFDRMPEAGGMLRYSIPEYRLPKDLVKQQIRALEKMGIRFKLNTNIGKKEFSRLKKKFKSVFLATGAWQQRALPIEKSDLLLSGMDFLTRTLQGPPPPVGERVLVIGGGNVAIDVAITAKRAGAKEVTMVCLEARDKMPAFPEEIEEALKAGVRLLPSWGPHRILETNRTVTGMELVRCTSVLDAEGRFKPSFDPEQKQTLEADQIILAIGQTTELDFLDKSLKLDRNLIQADAETLTTSVRGVFAGGDVVTGPATVVHAIAAGNRAASAMNAFLTGKRARPIPQNHLIELHGDCLTPSSRTTGTETVHIQREANRCINCSCIAVNASDLAPALLALDARIKTTQRTLKASDFFSAKMASSTSLEPGELVCEIEIPSAPPQATQRYRKFRIRNSIDFPIVSLVSILELRSGKFYRPRLVLGAVGPLPLPLPEVEEFLHGQSVTEETATVAAEIAEREMQPLARNGFKVQVVKALIKQAIMGD